MSPRAKILVDQLGDEFSSWYRIQIQFKVTPELIQAIQESSGIEKAFNTIDGYSVEVQLSKAFDPAAVLGRLKSTIATYVKKNKLGYE